MDVSRKVSITDSTTAADTLNHPPGREATGERQGDRNLFAENAEPYFKPWRVFINHIDSYHGTLLADVSISGPLRTQIVLSDSAYVDPWSARAAAPADEDGEEFEDEGDEHAGRDEGEEKRKRPDKSAEVSRKYEVIGTVLDREVISSSVLSFLLLFALSLINGAFSPLGD
ncbi:uncharacterized protein LOC112590201 [Harpegnathos saltator]|uniref:uncharacterized protein LOC112590201 n=1 Tax=Harpegnathos saltator TaxID=610380 RepID=UPI000DBEE9B1|nr:uncharacterized protein LOC112590201 [Harpegnathos saltator]